MINKYAILTNDMQVAIANKHDKRKKAVSKFLPKLLQFLIKARELEVPIIHLQLIKPDDDPKAHIPYGPFPPLVQGTEGVEILPEVLDKEYDIVVIKPKDSGFFDTRLDEVLKKMGVTNLVICGMQTQICVQTTAADAYFRNYKVFVPTDGVGSTREEDTARSLKWLKEYCAEVIPSEEILRMISLSKNNPN